MADLLPVFQNYKDVKIAIYGLGTETERVLSEMGECCDIVGLLDGFRESGELYGKPIIPLGYAVGAGVRMILVVARPGSCKAIAKRIGDVCKENDIELIDIRGKNLLADSKVVYDFKNANGYTQKELWRRINDVEAVSFDLFDTLIVRDVLSADDVHEIVAAKLEEMGVDVTDFVSKRIEIEKNMSRGHAPKLEQIYGELLRCYPKVGVKACDLANLEYITDVGLIEPRSEMVELVRKIKQGGKKVFVTSESYYSKQQIENILKLNNIMNVDGIVVSCEYDTGKTCSLFDRLIEAAGTKNILHIGDDIVADMESAKRHGLKGFQIYSLSELLDILGGLNLVEDDLNLSDRIRVGMFMANIFNNPFQFEDEDMKIHIDNAKDLGYLITAPMIFDFTRWFDVQVREDNLKNVWFCARDGYLIRKVYDLIYPHKKTWYFLTSRTAAIRAGVESVSDIEYVESMKYSGSCEDNLRARFGIDVSDLQESQLNNDKSGLLQYSDIILEIAKEKKINNIKYIDKLDVREGDIALFDFVAKGTSQMYIQRLVNNHIKGFYFLQLEPEFMRDKGLDITPFYTDGERDGSAMFDNYYILETILTSPDAQVLEFDKDGNACYATETRTKRNIECIMGMQEGVMDYVKRYLEICPLSRVCINKNLDESFLSLIHNIDIRDDNFNNLKVEDPFFNRMTDITDVL